MWHFGKIVRTAGLDRSGVGRGQEGILQTHICAVCVVCHEGMAVRSAKCYVRSGVIYCVLCIAKEAIDRKYSVAGANDFAEQRDHTRRACRPFVSATT